MMIALSIVARLMSDLGDRTDTAVDDAQLDLVVDLDLEQRLLERLDGTGHVTLDDEVERLDLALCERLG